MLTSSPYVGLSPKQLVFRLADARRLRSTLSEPLQAVLSRCESVETADDEACKAANEAFTERFVRGVKLLPDLPACQGSNRNDQIYRQMWGAAEFTATGSLRDFDRTAQLGELHLPVLFLAGKGNLVRDFTSPGRDLSMSVIDFA